jgi:hypothetical protein
MNIGYQNLALMQTLEVRALLHGKGSKRLKKQCARRNVNLGLKYSYTKLGTSNIDLERSLTESEVSNHL